MALRVEPTVTLINRVRDASGKVVPYTATFDGESEEIRESLVVPVPIARILVHNSMYRWDPHGGDPMYRLAVHEWGMDETPIMVSDLGDELLDRSDPSIGPRTTIHGTKLGKGRPLPEPRRRDPVSIRDIGEKDGAFPGAYGEMASSNR